MALPCNADQETDELRDKIISWMSPINFFVTQREIFSRFKTGTCEAIMGSPQLKLWMLGRGSRLLCCGIPGSGKTIFSALILQHLQDTQSANPDVKVAGIFCDYKETESQTPSNLLAAVWRQLTYDRTRLSDDAVGLYHANGKKGTRPNLSETTSVVTEELNRWQKVFVVIDAADECATGALAVILRVLELPHVNILVTSRTSGAGPFRQYASLSVQPTSLDLKLYVGSRIDESFVLLRHCEKDPSLRGEVIAAVVSKAKGMFLMARYHMDLIVGQDSVRRVRQALMSLPDELNAVYASMLDRVYSLEADRASRSRQLIALILFTTRPLTIDETRCALSIEPGDTCLNENDLPDLDVLLSACGGIIHVSSETQLLSFAHQTLAEYLLQAPPISSQTAHFMIARSCLTYVLFDSFAGGRCRSDDDLDARLRTHPLFLYSAQNWGMHTRTCGEAPDLHNLLNQLLYEKPKHRESSLQGLLLGPARFDGYSQTTPHQVPPLWLAAFFGLPAATLRLLGVGDGTAMVDSCASDGSTALSVAAKRGYTDVMAVLLDHGADVKTTGAVVVPLLEAAKRGQLEAASLLLQYGADVNARSSNGRSALHEAVVGGKEITALLLEKGADSESQTANFWGVLHSAVVAGDKDIVSQLIKKGASVYATTSDKETALHLAARRGLDSIVSLLLDAGADSKYIATDANGDTALHAAASHGHISTSTLLIQGGGDRINMPNTKGETPLYQAAMAGHTSVLDLLLANGA
ncbi:ankyrin repeat-containing domain protein, partial [Immersiella caudata]